MRLRGWALAWFAGLAAASVAGWAWAELSQEAWTREMNEELPPLLCGAETYFRTCFHVNRSECQAAAAAGLRACLEEIRGQLPAAMSDEDAQAWSHDLGVCVGSAMARALDDRRVAGDRCKRR
jgi:hypothetical protein